jgi:hypothetical protein
MPPIFQPLSKKDIVTNLNATSDIALRSFPEHTAGSMQFGATRTISCIR